MDTSAESIIKTEETFSDDILIKTELEINEITSSGNDSGFVDDIAGRVKRAKRSCVKNIDFKVYNSDSESEIKPLFFTDSDPEDPNDPDFSLEAVDTKPLLYGFPFDQLSIKNLEPMDEDTPQSNGIEPTVTQTQQFQSSESLKTTQSNGSQSTVAPHLNLSKSLASNLCHLNMPRPSNLQFNIPQLKVSQIPQSALHAYFPQSYLPQQLYPGLAQNHFSHLGLPQNIGLQCTMSQPTLQTNCQSMMSQAALQAHFARSNYGQSNIPQSRHQQPMSYQQQSNTIRTSTGVAQHLLSTFSHSESVSSNLTTNTQHACTSQSVMPQTTMSQPIQIQSIQESSSSIKSSHDLADNKEVIPLTERSEDVKECQMSTDVDKDEENEENYKPEIGLSSPSTSRKRKHKSYPVDSFIARTAFQVGNNQQSTDSENLKNVHDELFNETNVISTGPTNESNIAIVDEFYNNKILQQRKYGQNLPSNTSYLGAKIPRPPNAFMLFANDWRKEVAKKYPGDSNKQISCKLGLHWKMLKDEYKKIYFKRAKNVDMEHKKLYPDYVYNPKEARARKAEREITKLSKMGQQMPIMLPQAYTLQQSMQVKGKSSGVSPLGNLALPSPRSGGGVHQWYQNNNQFSALQANRDFPMLLDPYSGSYSQPGQCLDDGSRSGMYPGARYPPSLFAPPHTPNAMDPNIWNVQNTPIPPQQQIWGQCEDTKRLRNSTSSDFMFTSNNDAIMNSTNNSANNTASVGNVPSGTSTSNTPTPNSAQPNERNQESVVQTSQQQQPPSNQFNVYGGNAATENNAPGGHSADIKSAESFGSVTPEKNYVRQNNIQHQSSLNVLSPKSLNESIFDHQMPEATKHSEYSTPPYDTGYIKKENHQSNSIYSPDSNYNIKSEEQRTASYTPVSFDHSMRISPYDHVVTPKTPDSMQHYPNEMFHPNLQSSYGGIPPPPYGRSLMSPKRAEYTRNSPKGSHSPYGFFDGAPYRISPKANPTSYDNRASPKASLHHEMNYRKSPKGHGRQGRSSPKNQRSTKAHKAPPQPPPPPPPPRPEVHPLPAFKQAFGGTERGRLLATPENNVVDKIVDADFVTNQTQCIQDTNLDYSNIIFDANIPYEEV